MLTNKKFHGENHMQQMAENILYTSFSTVFCMFLKKYSTGYGPYTSSIFNKMLFTVSEYTYCGGSEKYLKKLSCVFGRSKKTEQAYF